jgi:type II secretory pathway predicted ATPase ExeA
MTGMDMLTYFLGALVVAALTGFTGRMPVEVVRRVGSDFSDDTDSADAASAASGAHDERDLPSEILDALAEVERANQGIAAARQLVAAASPNDPSRVVMVPRHRQLLAEIVDSLMEGTQFIVLTGARGAGKTAVAQAICEELTQRSVRVRWVDGGAGGGIRLRTIMSQFLGKPEADVDTADVERVFDAMTEREDPDDRLVLIIDDAEQLLPDALGYLRLLASVAIERMPQVLFVGDPSFWDIADRAAQAGFADLIEARFELGTLTPEEAGAVAVRLMASRGSELDTDARDTLVQRSEGLPGRLVSLMTAVAALATERNQTLVTSALVDAAAARHQDAPTYRPPADDIAEQAPTANVLVPVVLPPGRNRRIAQMAGLAAVAVGSLGAVACWEGPPGFDRFWAAGRSALQSGDATPNSPPAAATVVPLPPAAPATLAHLVGPAPTDAVKPRLTPPLAPIEVIASNSPVAPHGVVAPGGQWPAPKAAVRRRATFNGYVARPTQGIWLFPPGTNGGGG